MDWLTSLVEIVKAVAWPVAAVALVLLLRKPLSELVPLLKTLKYKDLELQFGQQVKALQAKAAEALPGAARSEPTRTPEADAGSPPIKDKAAQIAEVSPRAAVVEAWLEVERAAREGAARNGISVPAGAPMGAVLRELQRAGIVDDRQLSLIEELRSLRNEATHSPEAGISFNAAMDFARLAGNVAWYLEHVKLKPGGPTVETDHA